MSLPFRSLRLLAPMLLGLLLPVAALAEPARVATPAPATPKSPSKGEQEALAIFKMLDTNGDGRVSRAEGAWVIRLKPSLADLFREADLNGDGYLTQAEIRTVAERRRAERLARREREREEKQPPTTAPSAPARTSSPTAPAAASPRR